jgi:hypothetical protein
MMLMTHGKEVFLDYEEDGHKLLKIKDGGKLLIEIVSIFF